MSKKNIIKIKCPNCGLNYDPKRYCKCPDCTQANIVQLLHRR